MSVSPAVMGGEMASASRRSDQFNEYNERAAVPAKWRIGQIAATVLVLLLAVYYNTVGWQSPTEVARVADTVTLFDQIGFLVLIGLVWMTTPIAAAIALTTFHEAVRRRWMTGLMAFALVMIVLSLFFTWMQQGEEQKFLTDFGIGFIVLMTLLMAIFLGVALVPPEVDRRTIFTILSKPVDRAEFLIGKYLGLCLTLLVNLLLMSLLFLLAYAMFKIRREEGLAAALEITEYHPGLRFELSNLARALMLNYGLLMVMAALAMTFSLFLSHIAAVVLCFVAYFGGQASSYWEHLSGGYGIEKVSLAPWMQALVNAAYFVLPRLDRFDVRERIINESPIAFNYAWKAFGSGLIYVAILLMVAYLIFSDQEF